jgi:hypothetical protein
MFLCKTLLSKIKEKFEILEIIDFHLYPDEIFLELENLIKKYQDFSFKQNQIILFFYHDTSFYTELKEGCSTVLNNFYILLNKYNLPPEFLYILTNHYGLKKEIILLNKRMQYHFKLENVIETLLWYDFPKNDDIIFYKNQNLEFKNDFLYTCLNNVQRIHRSYFLSQLKENNLLDKGIVSYRFNQ